MKLVLNKLKLYTVCADLFETGGGALTVALDLFRDFLSIGANLNLNEFVFTAVIILTTKSTPTDATHLQLLEYQNRIQLKPIELKFK